MENFTLTAEQIVPILREYGISGAILNVIPLASRTSEKSTRFVAKLEVKHRSPLVLKLVRDPAYPHNQIERRCVFAEHLRRNGIATTEHYARRGQYCIEQTIDQRRYDITLEDFVDGEVSKLDLEAARKTGQLAARIHRISFRDNFKIGAPTRFNAIGRNSVSGIDRLRELTERAELSQFKSVTYPHRYCTKPELCREIIAIYDYKIASISDLWGRLPCSAVQGDLTLDNLFAAGDRVGVFDYNNAGDETLVGDMVLEGLHLALDTPAEQLADGLESDRASIFRSFFEGYASICPLTQDERMAACDIYPAFNALWLSRIARENDGDSSLEDLMLTPGRCTDADALLSDIYRLITDDARFIFATELFGNSACR